jgi:hypothetical protein
VVIGTLIGVVSMGNLGGSTAVGTLLGVTVCVGTLVGVALILMKSSASLLTAAIVSLETFWNGAGGGGIFRIFCHFYCSNDDAVFLCKCLCVAFCWK